MNEEERKEYARKYYLDNKERLLQGQKEYRERCGGEIKAKQKEWRKNNNDKDKARQRKWREENPFYHKIYHVDNKQRRSEYFHKYYLINKNHISELGKLYKKENIAKLSNQYIKTLLTNGSVLAFADIPQDLIELKRTEIQIKRGIKDVKENS